MLIVFTTTPNASEAEVLSTKIVEAKLAACVQVLPQMTSIYVWDGKLQKESEHLLLIKTLPAMWEVLRDFITANHSYETPEIAAVEAKNVSEPYINWLSRSINVSS